MIRQLIVRCLMLALVIGHHPSPACALDVAVQRVDDDAPWSGELVSLDSTELLVRDASGSEQVIARQDVWRLRQSESVDETMARGGPQQIEVTLTNGDRLLASRVEIADEYCLISRGLGGDSQEGKIPLEFVRAIEFARQKGDRFESSPGPPVAADVLLLNNGDRLSGEIVRVTSRECIIRTSVGETPVSRADLAAISFNSELMSFPQQTDEFLVVVLSDDSHLTAVGAELSDDSLVFRAAAEFELAIDWRSIEQIDFYGQRVISLADRPVTSFEFCPFIDRTAEYEVGRNISGGPLQVRGRLFARGLGVVPRSRLTFEIPEGDWSFHAISGVDDAARGAGSVEFSLTSGDEELYRSGVVTGQDAAVDVGPIDLSGRTEITPRLARRPTA